MSFLRALNISGSALTAQRVRIDIVSENISNMDTTRTENGEGPYRRKVVQFQSRDHTASAFRTVLGNVLDRRGLTHPLVYVESGRNTRAGMVNQELFESNRDTRRSRLEMHGLYMHRDAGVIVSAVIEDETPFRLIYDPTHPDSDEYGYVRMPNVDLLKETIDAMSASRSYEANVTALNAVKLMASKALEVGR